MHQPLPVPAPAHPEPSPRPREAPPRPEPLQVTIGEAARLLAYDDRTIYRLIACGELPSVGRGRLRRIPLQSLRDYQQRHLTTQR